MICDIGNFFGEYETVFFLELLRAMMFNGYWQNIFAHNKDEIIAILIVMASDGRMTPNIVRINMFRDNTKT